MKNKTRKPQLIMTAGILTGLFISMALFPSSSHASNKESRYVFPPESVEALPPDSPDVVYGEHIPRTMYLLSTSTKEKPNKVKILFYGQSITRQDYSRKIIEAKLRKAYPSAQLEVLNTAIGGYGAPRLVRTMVHNAIPHQPDLIVFHVYGGEEDGSYEQILKNFRKYTTAEVVCVTHHLDNYGEAKDKARDAASQLRRDLAARYGFELVEVRENWRKYLAMHGIKVPELLRDRIHHNQKGGELWGALQARHFEMVKADPAAWQDTITTIALKETKSGKLGSVSYDDKQWKTSASGLKTTATGATLVLEFDGTRVDVISRSGNGKAQIKVDGKSPRAFAETWSATLPSNTKIDYRPALTQARIIGVPKEEVWTMTFNAISEDGTSFSYALKGSVSGEQGRGDDTSVFTSRNGVFEINPKDITFSHAVQIKKKPVPVPLAVTWKTYNRSLETWKCEGRTKKNPSGQVTLVQQLENKKHRLEIILLTGTIQIDEIRIHRPAL